MTTTDSSLSVPSEREGEWKADSSAPVLTNEETKHAVEALVSNDIKNLFPRVERSYADPPIPLQTISLVSFIPAKGAKPNDDGVYGIAKIRGSFASESEASAHAEKLIRETDSFNTIHHAYTGRPFPITNLTDFSQEKVRVDLQRNTTEAITNNIREQKREKQRIAKELKERQDKLMEESKRAESSEDYELSEEERLDDYITQVVKNAHLKYTFCDALRKLSEVRERIIQSNQVVEEYNEKEPTFADKYYERFAKARKEAGYNDNEEAIEKSFVKFMVKNITVPTVDTEELLPEVTMDD
jgi:hypothetical protein